MRLLLARHGATANNAHARYTGQADIDLAPLGERQAEALAAALASEHLDCIITSDLRRARQTTAPIARYHDTTPVREDTDLREMSMGVWEGMTHEEILASDPEAAARWIADPLTYAPPAGESVATLRERIVRALDRWYAAYPDGTLLWVTHGGLIGVLISHLLDMDLNRRWQFRRDNAAITDVEIGLDEMQPGSVPPARYAIFMRINDTSHLKEINATAAIAVKEERQVL